MAKYREKPIEIEAIQYLREENISKVQDFVGEALVYNPNDNEYYIDGFGYKTKCIKGDYIEKHKNGEFYMYKKEVFEQLYELKK